MASSSSPDEQRNHEPQEQPQALPEPVKDCVYKTKLIQFLGRTLPIVLQNEQWPLPSPRYLSSEHDGLVSFTVGDFGRAGCKMCFSLGNIHLLRNHLNLSPETPDVSQEKLLSLVAERLFDSNSNVDNKDAGYVKNQQQNIADAIDLLPRLATGVDVNIKYRRIDDFEFTPECAIFDLLDIPLYHGWIVDPQDQATADAIGSKSYNALMGELVFLETKNMDGQQKDLAAEDSVDFVAATTATLGVPSPSISRAMSFDDSPHSASEKEGLRKGDLEEESELLRALKFSENDVKNSVSDPTGTDNLNVGTVSVNLNENTSSKVAAVVNSMFELDKSSSTDDDNPCAPELSLADGSTGACPAKIDEHVTPAEESNLSFKTPEGNNLDHSTIMEYKVSSDSNNMVDQSISDDQSVYIGSEMLLPPSKSVMPSVDNNADVAAVGDKVCNESTSATSIQGSDNMEGGYPTSDAACPQSPHTDSDSSSRRPPYNNGPESLTSNIDGGEPIYEGEECVLKTAAPAFGNWEPVYEGEAVLAEQNDKSTLPASEIKDEISPQQGDLIRNFLKNTASKLTFYGLFCLQEGLKERELCVFFHNNHFSTMFKLDGELYLLATDQCYVNQPDLVWEKLNEVNGDTLFMTGNFKEFKVESEANHAWDENNAVASTADHLASIDSAAQAGLDINNDLQLAIALQQQEFEQQPQRQSSQQPAYTGSSRLIAGPQVARSSGRQPSSSSRPERMSKDKDRCTVM